MEDDAPGFELCARGRDVVDVEGRGAFFCGAKGMPNFSGSQIPKQVDPAQNSNFVWSSGRNPSVST